MIIEDRLQYHNKTLSFLLPLYRSYGEEFVQKLSSVFKLACGIGDDNQNIPTGNNIFILVDSSFEPDTYYSFVGYIQAHDSYVTHYKFDSNRPEQIMFVLKIDQLFIDTYKNFVAGKYSLMMEDHEEIDIFFPSNTYSTVNQVCKRSKLYEESFILAVNKTFNTKITHFTNPEYEIEFPLVAEQEIFNSNPKRDKYIKDLSYI